MMGVFHCDCNSYYVSVELLFRQQLKGKALVVGGNEESRHGIVLAKSDLAKKYGIKTGVSLMEARKACPGLITLPPNYPLYLKFTKMMRQIILEYSDIFEAFGLDEGWGRLFGDSQEELVVQADKLRNRIHKELGITVSIGLSFNKTIAKLGSDMKKPNGLTTIWREDMESKVWPLPVSELLYVGPATTKKLNNRCIFTIGDLAHADPKSINRMLGVNGDTLWHYANGYEDAPIVNMGTESIVKSIGNSNTLPRDLKNNDDVKAAFCMLSESVAERMREAGFEAKTLQVYIRDNELGSFERQMKLPRPTNLVYDILPAAIKLFQTCYSHWPRPIRGLGVRGTDLVEAGSVYQLDMFDDIVKRRKMQSLERTIDRERAKFGHFCIQRGILMKNRSLAHDAKTENINVFAGGI